MLVSLKCRLCKTSGKQAKSNASFKSLNFILPVKGRQLWRNLDYGASFNSTLPFFALTEIWSNNLINNQAVWTPACGCCVYECVMCVYLCQIQTPHKSEAELLQDIFMVDRFKHLVFPSKIVVQSCSSFIAKASCVSLCYAIFTSQCQCFCDFSRTTSLQTEWNCLQLISSRVWRHFSFCKYV